MKVVLQRVSEASVDVVNELGTLDPTFEPQQIGPGFMILVGVTDEDGDKQIAWLAHKILNLRVFEDAQGKMNRSIQDIGGEILSISQFTLFADVHKGNRPSCIKAGKPVLEGASVKATVVSHGRHDKVRIFKFRRRKHSMKSAGHRQNYTELKIEAINA